MENKTNNIELKVSEDSPEVKSNIKKEQPKRAIYKKWWFWAILLLSILGVALGTFLIIYFSAQSKNKQAISDGWFSIVEKNKTLARLGSKIESQQNYDDYYSELKSLNALVDEKKYSAQKLKYKQLDAKSYENFLNEYQKYISESNNYASDIKNFSESNKDKLAVYSENSRNASNELKNYAKYLKDNLPESSFLIQNTLFEANKILLAGELSSKAKQLAEQAATAKDASDKKLVENTSGNFLNAFLAGNAPLIRQYMTEPYQREYDFNQLTSEARATTYPASFRILSNQKIEENKYKVQANVLFKFRDGSSQYIVGYDMNIIYDAGQSKWLVNSIKEGSSL